MYINPDIWNEIISYFTYPEDESTLRSLAVLSRIPSDFALDAIWRNGKTFLTIASVINSFAASPDGPFLEYIPEHSSGSAERDGSHRHLVKNTAHEVGFQVDKKSHRATGNTVKYTWVLNRPFPRAARNRSLDYLARIEKFSVSHSRQCKEDALWHVLSATLEHPGPLLPRLRHLRIHEPIRARMDSLSLLLPPTLRILEIFECEWPEDALVLQVLKLASAHCCDLRSFDYSGGQSHCAPDLLASFKNLHAVQISSSYSPRQLRSSLTIVEFLAALPSLRSLSCNLAAFRPCSRGEQICYTTLQVIEVVAPAPLLGEFFRTYLFPSLAKVVIKINSGNLELKQLNTTSKVLKKLSISCPNVEELDLHVRPFPSYNSPFEFQHLVPLLSLPMRVFALMVPRFAFAPSDFRAFSESWRDLHSFRIAGVSSDSNPRALSSLISFSNLQHLSHLDIGLRAYFLRNIAQVPDLIVAHTRTTQKTQSRTHSCTLYFVVYGGLQRPPTTTRADRRSLVECLLLAFPGLQLEPKYGRLEATTCNGQSFIELQEILSELRREKGEDSDGAI